MIKSIQLSDSLVGILGSLYIFFIIFLIVLAILWIILPFAVFRIKNRVDNVDKNLVEIGRILRNIEANNRVSYQNNPDIKDGGASIAQLYSKQNQGET